MPEMAPAQYQGGGDRRYDVASLWGREKVMDGWAKPSNDAGVIETRHDAGARRVG
jgi:hypothetical protein